MQPRGAGSVGGRHAVIVATIIAGTNCFERPAMNAEPLSPETTLRRWHDDEDAVRRRIGAPAWRA